MKCLYHANCSDGKAAALAVWMKYGDTGHEYIPVQYGQEPPEGLDNTDVVIVDFSYKKQQIRDLARIANSILILDHHKTAKSELADVDDGFGCQMDIIFDMTKSGAVLAWEYFHSEPVPDLFNIVQDRDLWTFNIHATKYVSKALQIYPDFRNWEVYVKNPRRLFDLQEKGIAIVRYMDMQIESIIATKPRLWSVTGNTVPLYNLPGFMLSDTLHMALIEYPECDYAVGYFDLLDKRVYSLRSRSGSDVDVSDIARHHGGGGHKHAAGFTAAI